jgi:hypothetical protein
MHTVKQQIAIFSLVILVSFVHQTHAQLNAAYTFSSTTSTWAYNGGTILTYNSGSNLSGFHDDRYSDATNIGFTFTYNCVDYTQFRASTNGWLSLGTLGTNSVYTNNAKEIGYGPILAALWDDLAINSTGNMNYQTSGSAPNRVLTVEWRNMEWKVSNSTNVAISFQIKLYETTNVIDFIYQRESGSVDEGSATISINSGISTTFPNDFLSLNGTGGSPTAVYGSETADLNSKPTNGRIYRWTPTSGAKAYASSTTVQNNSNTSKCGVDQQIVGVQVVVSGSPCSAALALTQFQINMTGSTIPGTNTNDVSTIHIYYTGINSSYAPSSEFFSGGTTPAAGTITINGSQALYSGTNYFWIAYDINTSTATLGNVVDARCTQITVGGVNQVPSTTAPAGSRSISACSTSPGGVSDNMAFWIKASAGTSSTTDGNTISSWNDQSGNARNASQTTAANRPTYHDNASDNLNFNPVVDFSDASQTAASGADYMDIASNGILASGNNRYAVYAVIKPKTNNTTTPGKFLYMGTEVRHGFTAFDVRPNNVFKDTWNNNDNTSPTNQWSPNYPSLLAYDFESTQRQMWSSGTSLATTVGNYRNVTNVNSALGCSKAADFEYYHGSIADIITYPNTSHTQTTRNKIESYLGIKYGITLSHNYVSSTGAVVWNRSTNASYNNNIIGIARDDISTLSQKQSKSTSSSADILTVYIGPSKQTNQNNNSGTFSGGDGSFFMVGHNGLPVMNPTAPHNEVPATICCRLRREWFSQQTNFTNTDLTLEFDIQNTTLNIADLRLLVDDDGNFINATILTSPSITIDVSGTLVTITASAANFSATPYFTLGSIASTTPLPVELTRFSGVRENENIKLAWTTASEINNSFFTVERSQDGKAFETIGMVNGAGNSKVSLQYSLIDTKPYQGISYYRLKQTDFDDSYKYSNVIRVNYDGDIEFLVEVYPNPGNGSMFNLDIKANAGEEVNIVLYDITGTKNCSKNILLEKNEGKFTLHPAVTLAPGAYLLIATTAQKNVIRKTVIVR